MQIINRKKNHRLLLLEKMPKGAVCSEVGVWKGDFSDRILSITSPKKLHLIDPWEFQSEFPERMYGGSVAKNQNDMDAIYQGVIKRFSNRPNVVFNRGKSKKIISEFKDNYFDWVYIDGNHYYEYVLNDLNYCLQKVKPGGFITGDDYTWGEKYCFPVKQAVLDFIRENDLERNLKVLGSQFIIKI